MKDCFRSNPRKIDNKMVRVLEVARNILALGPTPCGCVPRLVGCDCPQACCRCPVELELCRFEANWPRDEEATDVPEDELTHLLAWDSWEGQEEFDARLAAFYRRVDPWHYNSPQPPRTGMLFVTRGLKIEAMSERVAAGLSPFSKHDLSATGLKFGEQLGTARNGATIYRGIQGVQEAKAS